MHKFVFDVCMYGCTRSCACVCVSDRATRMSRIKSSMGLRSQHKNDIVYSLPVVCARLCVCVCTSTHIHEHTLYICMCSGEW